jgi:hypothetical protein
MVLLRGAGSAAAVGCRRRAFSLRLDGRTAAVIAAMACARWTKDPPALLVRTDGVERAVKAVDCTRPGASRNHRAVPRASLRDSSL